MALESKIPAAPERRVGSPQRLSEPFVTATVAMLRNSRSGDGGENAAIAGTFSAPRETRTPTPEIRDKALNLADGVPDASAGLSSAVSVRGGERYGRMWQGICYRGCYRANTRGLMPVVGQRAA